MTTEERLDALEATVKDMQESLSALIDMVTIEEDLPGLEKAHRALVRRVREGAQE